MEAGATGPPNHTKAAPQLFGGDAGLPEVPVLCAELPDLPRLLEPSCYQEDWNDIAPRQKRNGGVPKIHVLLLALNRRQRPRRRFAFEL